MSADNAKQKKFVEKLYAEHYTPMMRFATSLLKDPFRAEVAVQETFLVALKK